VRARVDAVHSLRRAARQQLSGFLLRHGCHYGRPAWTKLHRRWLAGLKFEQAVHHLVLEDYVQAVEAAAARRVRLTAQIAAMLPDWTLAPVVAALQTMRAMALVNAATLITELGDLARFANPRQLMAYLGLVPSKNSIGASIRRRHNKTKLRRTGGRAGRAQDQRGVKVAGRRRDQKRPRRPRPAVCSNAHTMVPSGAPSRASRSASSLVLPTVSRTTSR
jgi:transposase